VRESSFGRATFLLVTLLLIVTAFTSARPAQTTGAVFVDSAQTTDNTFATGFWATQSVVLVSLSDADVNEAKPNKNYGSGKFMMVNSDAGGNRRVYLRFDLSTIPVNSTIQSATLSVCAQATPKSTRTYEVHRATEDWNETSVVWNNQPSAVSTVSAVSVTPASPGCMAWSVETDVQSWTDGSAGNYGWRINDSVENATKSLQTKFKTLEDASGPTLTVTYSEP
jgi:hypothetical protein